MGVMADAVGDDDDYYLLYEKMTEFVYLRMVLLLQEIEFFLYSFECVSYCEFQWARLWWTL